MELGSSPGFVQGVFPAHSLGDHPEQPLGWDQVVVIGGADTLPAVTAVVVGCRKTKLLHQPGLAVAAMVGQGLARPLARDQDPAPGVAQMLGPVRLALTPARDQALARALGCDAISEPVRAPRRARLIAKRLDQPGHMRALSVGVCLMAFADLLHEVLGEVADAVGGVFGPCQHALRIKLGPEPDNVPRVVAGADRIHGFIPRRQQIASGRIEIPA